MYNQGITYRKIGEKLGCNRQRASSLVRFKNRKRYTKPLPIKSEKQAKRILKANKVNCTYAVRNDIYDLITESGKRIEVKYRKYSSRNRAIVSTIPENYDFLVLLLEYKGVLSTYVFPSGVFPQNATIIFDRTYQKTKLNLLLQKHQNAFHLIY